MPTFETISFYEGGDRFTTRLDFRPHGYVNIGKDLYSFSGGKLHQHGQGALNEYYGQLNFSRIRFMVNSYQGMIKIFKTLSIEGKGKPEKIIIRTRYPYQQETDIIADEIEEKEGKLYAALLNDKLSPNVSGTEYEKMLKGDPLRAVEAEVEIIYSPGQDFELRFYRQGFLPSSG